MDCSPSISQILTFAVEGEWGCFWLFRFLCFCQDEVTIEGSNFWELKSEKYRHWNRIRCIGSEIFLHLNHPSHHKTIKSYELSLSVKQIFCLRLVFVSMKRWNSSWKSLLHIFTYTNRTWAIENFKFIFFHLHIQQSQETGDVFFWNNHTKCNLLFVWLSGMPSRCYFVRASRVLIFALLCTIKSYNSIHRYMPNRTNSCNNI